MYPNCGEAVVVGVRSLVRPRPARDDSEGKGDEGPKDPERCRREAVARARRTIRRYCTEHRLLYMWTLTYAGCGEHDLARGRRHVERMLARIAEERGRRFPYLVVPELHPKGHGIHFHIAVGFFYPYAKLRKAWAKGFVWAKNMKRPGECGFLGARRAANYAAKYVGKAIEETPFGGHRYERAQGFPVASYRVRRWDMDDGQQYVEAVVFQAAPIFVWDSTSVEDWQGPRCRVLFFGVTGAPDG